MPRHRDKGLSRRIGSAALRLRDKLLRLDLRSLGVSEYNQRYLEKKISGVDAALRLYGYLLKLSLPPRSIPLDRCVWVEYGGGSGMLSFLAKETGVGTVIYNDIYDVSCKDVRRISDSLRLPLDHIVCGEVDDVIAYVRARSISVHSVASYDVIEHIYDIEGHARKLALLSDRPFRVVYASGANSRNPAYVRRVTRQHRKVEYENRERPWGWKERDTLRAYLEVRRELIAAYAPELSPGQAAALARITRGLRKEDIERCVDEYRKKGAVAYRPDHPTNTCDPYTGNWNERLMKIRWLRKIFRDAGFSVIIRSGYWTSGGSLPVRMAGSLLNGAIRVFGGGVFFFSPYYVVCANRFRATGAPSDGSLPPPNPVRNAG